MSALVVVPAPDTHAVRRIPRVVFVAGAVLAALDGTAHARFREAFTDWTPRNG